MTRPRIGRAFRIAGYGAAAFVLLLAAVFGVLQSDFAKNRLKTILGQAVSEPGVAEISAARLEGLVPFHFRVLEVSVADAAGPWLTAERLEFDLDVLSALGGRYRLRDAVAEGVALLRVPEDESSEADPFVLPHWPEELGLAGFRIPELRLAPALAGTEVALTAEGRIEPDWGKGAMARLLVLATEGSDGFLDLDFAAPAGAEAPRLALTLHEPEGGLLARRLALPGAPALSLDIAGAGHGDSWEGRVSGGFAHSAEVDASVHVRGGEKPRVRTEGRADIAGLLDPALADLLRGGIVFTVEASRHGEHDIEVHELALDAAAGRLDAEGRLDLATLSTSARATLSGGDLAAFARAYGIDAEGRLEASAQVSGPLSAPALVLEVALDQGRIETTRMERLTASIDLEPLLDGTAARLDGEASGLAALPPEIERLVGTSVAFDAGGVARAGGIFELDHVSLDGEAAALEASGTFREAGAMFNGHLALRLPDLSVVDPALAGGGVVAAVLTANVAAQSGQAQITGWTRGLRTGIGTLDALAGDEPTLDALVTRDADGQTRIADLAIAGRAARLTGALSLDAAMTELEGDVHAVLSDLSLLSAPLGVALSGRAAIDARLSGPVANPGGVFDFRAETLRIANADIGALTGTLEASDLLAAPRGSVRAQSNPRGLSLTLASEFAVEDRSLRLSGLELGAPQGALRGDLAIGLDSGLLSGGLDGEFASLSNLGEAAGFPLDGAAEIAIGLSALEQEQAATLDLTARNLTTLAAPSVVAAEALRAQARLSDPFGAPEGTVSLVVERAMLDDVPLARVSLELRGSLERVAFDLAARGAEPGSEAALEASGHIAREDGVWGFDLASLDGHYGAVAITQQTPLRLLIGENRVRLDGLDLEMGDGRLKGALAVEPATLGGTLQAERLPLGVVRSIDPDFPLGAGSLSGTLALSGTRASPAADLALELSELRLAEADAPALDVALAGTWRMGRVRLAGEVAGVPETEVRLETDVPLALAPDALALEVPSLMPLAGRLTGRGQIQPLAEALLPSEDRFEGRFNVALELDGTVEQPRLSGTGSIRDGLYENFAFGTLLTALEADIEGDAGGLALRRFQAQDGGAGVLRAHGDLDFAPSGRRILKLEATIENATLIRRDEATAEASGRLELEGDENSARLSGALTVQRAEINIPDRFASAPRTIPVIEINRPVPTEPPIGPPAKATRPSTLALDLVIDMPGRVFVRGRGLDSEWRGRIAVSGTAAEPALDGVVGPIRGVLNLIGRTFELGPGAIRFLGGSPPDPELDLVASTSSADMTAYIRASGRLSAPQIALESDPALPSDEILARLLFGKSAGEVSAAQAAQLAAAAATLSGEGPDILSDIRATLGVDTLTVTADEEKGPAGAALSIGKYVTDEVFIGVEQGLTEGSGKVNVEVDVMPNVTVESEVGADAQSNVWMNWKFLY